MTAIAEVTLDDGQSTPVEHTFAPSTIDQAGVAKYFEVADIFDARKSLSASLRLPSKGSQVARIQLKVNIPVMDEVTPTLKVGDAFCNIEFVVPKRATLDMRKDLLAFAKNYLAEASVVASVHALESVY